MVDFQLLSYISVTNATASGNKNTQLLLSQRHWRWVEIVRMSPHGAWECEVMRLTAWGNGSQRRRSFDTHRPLPDMELGHWVTGSMGHLGHLLRPGYRVTGSLFWPGVDPEFFFRFSKKYPKCKMNIWNAEMTKVIVRCLLFDWNHWISVDAMNFHFYLWLLKFFGLRILLHT